MLKLKENCRLDRSNAERRDLPQDRFLFAEPSGSRLRCTPLEMTILLNRELRIAN